MFQLYKKRGFSELVGDTFSFLKVHGKNYFKNYFIINGLLILLLCVLIYLFTKIFLEGIFSSVQQPDFETNFISQLNNNMSIFIGFGVLMFVLILIVSMLNYLYPIVYFNLVASNTAITNENIFKVIKKKIGKTILFFLAAFVIFIPLFLILGIIAILLMFTIIGIPVSIIILCALLSFMQISYFEYINTNQPYFTALGNAFEILKKHFWPIIGSSFVMYIIVQVVVSAFSMIPYFIMIATLLTNPEYTENPQSLNSNMSLIAMFMIALMLVSLIVNFIMQNLILINHGIIYYSAKEVTENIAINNDIDLIGNESE